MPENPKKIEDLVRALQNTEDPIRALATVLAALPEIEKALSELRSEGRERGTTAGNVDAEIKEQIYEIRGDIRQLRGLISKSMDTEERALRDERKAVLDRRLRFWTTAEQLASSPVTQHLLRALVTVLIYGIAYSSGLPVTPSMLQMWLSPVAQAPIQGAPAPEGLPPSP